VRVAISNNSQARKGTFDSAAMKLSNC
jgi:hypothetical protein